MINLVGLAASLRLGAGKGAMGLQFQTPLLASQFIQLRRKNYSLATVAEHLALHVWQTFRKNIVITNIFRTMQQQQTVYGRGAKKISPEASLHAVNLRDWVTAPSELGALRAHLQRAASPHMFWHAFDIRNWIYTPAEVADLLRFLHQYDAHNQLPEIPAARSRTVWLHEAGTKGPHFHIQYQGAPWSFTTPSRAPRS